MKVVRQLRRPHSHPEQALVAFRADLTEFPPRIDEEQTQVSEQGAGIWTFGATEVADPSGAVRVAGAEITLDRQSGAVLLSLLRASEAPVSKDELLAAGWPGRIVHENSLAKAISRLRQALGDDAGRIEAVYGSGYRLTGPVSFTPAGPEAAQAAALSGGRWRRERDLRRWLTGAGAVLGVALLMGAGALIHAAQSAHKAADLQARQVDALLAFISVDILRPADPYASAGQSESLRDLVERTASTLETKFRHDPATRIVLHRAIANAFSGWGEYEKAVTHLDAAYLLIRELNNGRESADTVPVDGALCQNLRLAGDTRRAESVCERAEQTARRARAPQLQSVRITHAKLLFEIGRYEDAASVLAGVLETSGLSGMERADAEWFYALSLRKLARYDLADPVFRRHLTLRQTLHGDMHPLTAWAHADYGDFLVSIGAYDKAGPHLDEADRVFTGTLGPDHPESLSPAYSRAIAHLWRGEADEARAILAPMLARYRETLGADHFWTLYTMSELALAEAMRGQVGSADALLREARQTGARVLYGRPAKAAHFHLRWARALAVLGRAEEAADEGRRAEEAMDKARFAPDHPWRARLHCVAALTAGEDAARKRDRATACRSGLEAAQAMPGAYPALTEARDLLKRG
jgi:DNA-binding winged helix-turn-helix (wHTH) protein